MNSPCLRYDEYELSRTSTHASEDQESSLLSYDQDQDIYDAQFHLLPGQPLFDAKPAASSRLASLAPTWLRKQYHQRRSRAGAKRLARFFSCSPRSFLRKLALFSYVFFTTILIAVIVGGIFFPGYTHPPPHYGVLRERVLASEAPGRANLQNQKIFIAASIFDKDGRLFSGEWAENVLELIQMLGPKNVFLSIYVNDSGPEASKALEALERRVPCDHSLVFEDHLNFDDLPHVTLPDGTKRVKRIEYLAEVRNRALRPIESSNTIFDKLLYLNDVVFHPIDATQLLFLTNTVVEGETNYRAACAVDFINPFKFYDTFATRDIEGYSMGLPFFPWFAANGDEQSHQDVLDGKDAVRVRSCWGGMVAFDAQFFQKRPGLSHEVETAGHQSPANLTVPYRFRAEKDQYWDASECCLIHADIQSPEPGNSGIYMNPFVRVAYDTRTLSWLGFTRRFERLYTPIHFLIDTVTSKPAYNPRRYEEPWQGVKEIVWIPDDKSENHGSFQRVARIATHTGFCGHRSLTVMKEDITEGERNWEIVPTPS